MTVDGGLPLGEIASVKKKTEVISLGVRWRDFMYVYSASQTIQLPRALEGHIAVKRP
jgi:hypothetical protein